VQELKEGQKQTVTVVSTRTPLLHYLPRALREFWEEYPGVEVRTQVKPAIALSSSVKSGAADLAILSSLFLDESLAHSEMGESAIACVCSPDHFLASRSAISAVDLVTSRLAITPSTTRTRRLVDDWFHERGVNLANVMEVSSPEEVRTAALEGLAVGFASRAAVLDDILDGRLMQLDVHDFYLSRLLFVTYRPDAQAPATRLADLLVRENEGQYLQRTFPSTT
jgi:DNA-binding transcriptional LysR family regulator